MRIIKNLAICALGFALWGGLEYLVKGEVVVNPGGLAFTLFCIVLVTWLTRPPRQTNGEQ